MSRKSPSPPPPEEFVPQRLQKILARAGIASRRKAEQLIEQGRVSVNGEVAKLGQKAIAEQDTICVDNLPIESKQSLRYIKLNKPRGYITAVQDDRGRPVVLDLLPDIDERIYPVGRLDYDSEGVLLLTNDGDLAHKMMHPTYQIPRTYHVKVRDNPKPETLRKLQHGVTLDDGLAQALHVERLRPTPGGHTWIEIVLTEGRNREVRRMCEAIGHPVLRLKRVKYANLHVDDLHPGESRPLTPNELLELRSMLSPHAPKKPRRTRR